MSNTEGSSIRFSVAMCTYNGAQFVEQQLDSILKQTLPPSQLIICDDGSTDNTVELIENALRNTAISHRIIRNACNLGVIRNFEQAIAACDGSHIVLADQDDAWHRERLAYTAAAIEAQTDTTPALYYFEPDIIDADGVSQAQTFWQRARITLNKQPLWKTLAVRNVVPGCCIAFDASLRELALPIPGSAIMHDWWINLIAATGGQVVDLKRPLLAYRLHDSNEQGVNSLGRTAAHLRKHSASDIARNNLRATLQQCQAVKQRIGEQDSVGLEAYLALFEHPPLKRLRKLRELGIHPASRIKTLQMLYAATQIHADDIDGSPVQYL